MRFHRFLLLPILLALAASVACAPVKDPAAGAVPVMGQSDLTAEQMAGYFWAHQPPARRA